MRGRRLLIAFHSRPIVIDGNPWLLDFLHSYDIGFILIENNTHSLYGKETR
jgi:hypothetical protein